jgi:hypothetical protein
MVRKSLLVATLAVLALDGGRAAQADPVFLEPYGELYSARTFAASPSDERPKDAVQGQRAGEDAPSASFIISPLFWRSSIPLGGGVSIDPTIFGGTLGYASVSGAHPWSLTATIMSFDPDVAGDEIGFDIAGKYTLWQGPGDNTLAVSLVGRYMDVSDLFRRFDLLLAADHKVFKDIYATVNVGYSNFKFDGGGTFDDLKAGVGLTWAISPRLSLSGNYIFKNEADSLQSLSVDGIDTWSLSAAYAFNDTASIRFGGGKHETFFANLNWRWK